MKKYKYMCIILAAVIAASLPGCSLHQKGKADRASAERSDAENRGDAEEQSVPESTAVPADTEAETKAKGSGDASDTAAGGTGTGTEGQTQPTFTEKADELTGGELAEFEAFVNQGNYGFLLSEYESPEYIDLNQVFYTGAGIEQTPLTKEEEKAYLSASKSDEIFTDMTRLTKSQIDRFLRERTGIGFGDVKTKFFWTYVPEFDSYYMQHGDTNYTKFICESGTKANGVWKVRARGTLLAEGGYICEVTAEKKTDGSGFLFLANDIIKDEWWITENQAGVDTMAGLRSLTAAYMKSKGFSDHTYNRAIFDSDMRFYTKEELGKVNPKLYPVFRNEIYARHGYIFKNEDWNEFFRPYTWYHSEYGADSFDQSCFNQFEEVNLKLIMELEKK